MAVYCEVTSGFTVKVLPIYGAEDAANQVKVGTLPEAVNTTLLPAQTEIVGVLMLIGELGLTLTCTIALAVQLPLEAVTV